MKLNGVQNNNFDFQCMDKKRQSKAKQSKTNKKQKWHKNKTNESNTKAKHYSNSHVFPNLKFLHGLKKMNDVYK